MSYQRAIKSINLELSGEMPQMEILEHPEYVRKVTGIDPYRYPRKAFAEAYKRLDTDIVLGLPSETIEFKNGEIKKDKNGKLRTQWGVGAGVYWEKNTDFKSIDDLFTYDPFSFTSGDFARAFGSNPNKSVSEMAQDLKNLRENDQKILGESCFVPAAHYYTLFHYFVTTFGWEITSYAAMEHPEKFKSLIERYAEMSIKISNAWSMLEAPLFVSHDDIAMKTGPIFSPAWYRENIFPWYKEIWKPLKEKGSKILFFSDGDISQLVDDIMNCGADGIIFEPLVDLASVLKRYGGKKIIVGNINSAILTFKGKTEVRAEVDRCISLGKNTPGYFLCATQSLPQNIPAENIEEYFNYSGLKRKRGEQSCRESKQ